MDTGLRHRATLGRPAEDYSTSDPYGRSTSWLFPSTANALRRLKDDAVLVVGHITIPNIIAELGGPQLPTICESVFSDVPAGSGLGGTAPPDFVMVL